MPNDQSFDKTSKPFELTRQSANSSSLSCALQSYTIFKGFTVFEASTQVETQRKQGFYENRIYKYDIRNFNDSSKLLTPKLQSIWMKRYIVS